MGAPIDATAVSARVAAESLLREFARRLWDRYQARVYLFGSRARGAEHAQSDYDLVAVAASFATTSWLRRCLDRDSLWLDAGGCRKPLDLHCYTPQEFRRQKAGPGYLGQAHRRGELIRISASPRRSDAGMGHLTEPG
jgi:Nucleotidyltransferase domain